MEMESPSMNIDILNMRMGLSAEIIDIEEISASDLPDDIKKAGCVISVNRLNPCGIGQ